MNHYWKRSLSLLLAIVMILSMTVTASADVTLNKGDKILNDCFEVNAKPNANYPWSASGSGNETVLTCNSKVAAGSILQLKNLIEERTLTFDFTIDTGTFSYKVGSGTWTSLSSSGSVSVRVPAGAIVYLKIANGTVTISNIHFDPDLNDVTVTFEPAEHGTYTVDETEITDITAIQKTTLETYQLVATPEEGYDFISWFDLTNQAVLSYENPFSLSVLDDCTVTARFARMGSEGDPFCVNDSYFPTFEDARTFAGSVGSDTVVLVQDYTLTEDLTVPEGITLLIPFNDEHDCFTDQFVLTGGDPRVNNSSYTTPSAYKTLTVSTGVTLTVNGGLSVSGQHFASMGSKKFFGPNGPCGFVYLQSGAELTVNGGLYAYGFVTGPGHVTVNSGAEVYELMQIAGFRGGGATFAMVQDNRGVFPLSQYYIQNVESEMTLVAGAVEYVVASLQPGEGSSVTSSAPFIHPTSGMFRMSEGTLTKSYQGSTDRMTLDVNGTGSIDSLVVDLSAVVSGVDVDSGNFVLPITNNISINVNGGTIALGQDIAFLPGTQVNVAEGATVEVESGNKVFVYDRDEWMSGYFCFEANNPRVRLNPILYSPTKSYTRTEADLVDARMDVNGTLIVKGEAYSTESGAEIVTTDHSGRVVFENDAGTEAVTYQYDQSQLLNKYTAIPINPVWLKNGTDAELPFTETAEALAGYTYGWSESKDMWVRGLLLSFDANGGEGTMEPQFLEIDDDEATETIKPNAFTRSGYRFVGWALATDGELVYEDKDPFYGNDVGDLINTTLYAVWEETQTVQYRVTYLPNSDDYSGTMNPDFVDEGQPHTLKENAFTREGYDFNGWNTKADGSGDPYADKQEIAAVTADLTLYAQWKLKTHHITWKNWDGTVLYETDVDHGTVPAYPSDQPTPTRETSNYIEYTFIGWSPSPRAALTDQTYTARFSETEITFTVQYALEGGTLQGSNTQNPMTVPGGTTITLYDAARKGYTLQWKDGDDVLYNAGDSYTVVKDVTFTAVWTPVTYTVTFLPGNSSAEGSMNPMSVEHGKSYELPDNGFTLEGMELDYWRDRAGNMYPQKNAQGQLISYTFEEDTELTAVWKVMNCEVTFLDADGTVLQQYGIDYGNQCTLYTPSARLGYTIRWYCENDNNMHNPGDRFTVTEPVTFRAVWTLIEYTIPVDFGYETSNVTFTVEDLVYNKLGTPTWEGHRFTGWYLDQNSERIAQNANYDPAYTRIIAQWELLEYTITWVDGNGDTLKTEQVPYGTTPAYTGDTPTKTATAQYTYTFNNTWSPEIVAVTEAATYTAQFDSTVNEYTITWLDGNGDTLKTEQVAYGETPVYTGETPTKTATAQYTYTFNNTWTPEIVPVTGEATYTAQFSSTVNEYTITWVDGNGDTLKTEQVAYGTTPAYTGDTPTKAATAEYSYTFNNTWSPEIVAVTGEATYTAQFDQTANVYTVTFTVDGEPYGEPIQVAYGAVIQLPEEPTKEGYHFSGWQNVPATMPAQDVTISGIFGINEYTIRFLNGETVLQTLTVVHGATPKYTEAEPTKDPTNTETFSFSGWSPEIEAATKDQDYVAQFTASVRTYTITWVVDDTVTTESYEYGQTPVYKVDGVAAIPTKTATAQYTFTFAGWDPEIVAVTEAATYTAKFDSTVNKYTITFVDEDGTTVLKEATEYDYGTAAADIVKPADPTKAATAQYTYTFAGWTPEIAEVTGDQTYKATYSSTVNEYTITFVDEDGTVLQSGKVAYGTTPAYTGDTSALVKPATAQYSYTFAGWTPEIAEVTGDATYTATYSSTVNEYTITFKNVDGTELQSGKVAYGETPAYTGETPTKPATAQYTYTFAGWDPEIVPVTGDKTYTATYSSTVNKYVITFVDEDGTVLKAATEYDYGTAAADIVKPADPTKEADEQYTYTFAGWAPAIVDVTGDATYTATYTTVTNEYEITWVDGDGTELQSGKVAYGETPVYNPADPTKEADAQYTYTFAGWDPAIDMVTANQTYTATYSETLNKYTVTWVVNGETVETDRNVAYGTTPEYNGDTPTKASTETEVYTFAGWDPEIGPVNGDITYTATFSAATRMYKVQYQNYNGTLLQEYEVEYNQPVPAYEYEDTEGNDLTPVREQSEQYTYTFSGWNPEIGENDTVTEDLVYTAQFSSTLNEYTITWVDGNGDTLKTEQVAYGETPAYSGDTPTKTATAQYTYTFAGWDPEIVAVTGNATYTAQFDSTVNKYMITWVVNGETVETDPNVEYGTMPVYNSAEPARTAGENEDGKYTFIGWDPEITEVTGDATYTATFSFTGWRKFCDNEEYLGKKYYVADEVQTGWLTLGELQYYLDPENENYAAESTVLLMGENDPGHAFDADGVWMKGCSEQVFHDLKNNAIYLVEDGIVEVFPGLYKTDDSEYYYFGEDNKAVRGEVKWVEKNHADPDDPTDRGLLPKWDYEFGEDGIIKHESVDIDGIVTVTEGTETVAGVYYYYIDGIRVHYGMFYKDGYYYYADRTGKLIVDRTYWCTDNYGLMKAGPYQFDNYGRMIVETEEKNGFYYEENGDIFYYVDGSRFYAGLMHVGKDEIVVHYADGSTAYAAEGYYYVRTNGDLARDRSYWITKTNNIEGFEQRAYNFDANGRMILEKNGIFEEDGSLYYYVNGLRNYAGLIKIDGDYYYVKTNCEVVHGRSYWITKTNGLLPEKAYTFADDGKMILDVPEGENDKNGIVAENGSLWYYVDGKLTYAGLIEIDGAYYYVRTNGELVHGRSYWITKTNDIEGFKQGAYNFAEDGKLILP